MILQASIDLNCVIVKEGDEYCVKSEDNSKNLGCKPNKAGAKKRLQQVEYFKHLKAGGPGSGRHKENTGNELKYDKRQMSIYGPKHTEELVERKNRYGKLRQDQLEIKPKTIAGANKYLKKAGIEERIARGKGYIYWTGGQAHTWYSSSLETNSTKGFTIKEIIDDNWRRKEAKKIGTNNYADKRLWQ